MKHTLDPIKGMPVMRFCDRLDGFMAGVQAAVAVAKDLRIKEAVEADSSQPESEEARNGG